MKKFLLASALALAAAAQAQAAPAYVYNDFARGSWTCTVAHAPNMKLFLEVRGGFARAAVRQYPYYGKTEYNTLRRLSYSFTAATFRGPSGFLSLRASSPGVMKGAGRIGTSIMLLTCARS